MEVARPPEVIRRSLAATMDPRPPEGPKRSQSAPVRRLTRLGTTRKITGLHVYVYRILENCELVPCSDPFEGLEEALEVEHARSADDLLTSHEAQNKHFWVDVDADERDGEELKGWLRSLNLGEFITNILSEQFRDWVSRVVTVRNNVLITIRILPPVKEDGTFETSTVDFLAAFKSKNMLMTYSPSGGSNLLKKKNREYMKNEAILEDGSVNSALIVWLEFHIMRTCLQMRDIRHTTLVLLQKMDNNPESVSNEEILKIRERMLVVLGVAEEQATCLGMLRKLCVDSDEDSADFKGLKGEIYMLVSTAEATERMGLRIEKNVLSLKESYDSHQQAILNRRLDGLTVVSLIFLPLTFFCGVYGMNFSNMPELETYSGYFVWWGAIGILSISLTSIFYRMGFFS